MADEIDVTTERMEVELRARIDAMMLKPTAEGPKECTECGNEMPQVRRAYGFRLCVECQSALEKRSKLRAA